MTARSRTRERQQVLLCRKRVDGTPPTRFRQSRTCCRSLVRDLAVMRRWSLPSGGCERPGQPARSAHVVDLLILVHAAQKKNTAMYAGRRLSGGHAATDRMGCSLG